MGWDNLYLVRGLKAPLIRRRVASEQDSWRTMEDVFDNISCIARTEERNKIYSEPNFEAVSEEWVQEVSKGKYTGKTQPVKPIMTRSIGHKLTLISGVAVGNIIINPVRISVAASLTENREG